MSEENIEGHDLEQEPQQTYYQAARFEQEQDALNTYQQLQDILLASSTAELSAYRFLLNQISHVIVLGDKPAEELEAQLIGYLANSSS